ncbi:hypothetical protein FEM48_Zijuj12G0115700 [Ziziphus jujuba var. spinosa]|uniref:Subtilisin-like protease SBT1.7 n=1 Tax=Ziziphus jujuba var. spinosa TaxID=714518 RepID=A0A978UD29_ZIZJJ|nr:hypothetical protein FEM48_Zijuj12G0115700 [Ziziphus jujuba var. spinosa]
MLPWTVTNVGEAKSTLEKFVLPGIGISVTPEKLVFSEINHKATYTVKFIPQNDSQKDGKLFVEGYLKWVSRNYSGRSPIPITFMEKSALEMIMFPPGLVLVLTFATAVAEELEQVSSLTGEDQSISQTYIIFTKKPEGAGSNSLQYEDLNTWYQSFLPTSTTPNQQQPQIVHTYRNVVTGFAARLTANQVKAMEDKEGVIIGIVDTGIWPDHPSFGDEGVPPPPAKWKERCEFNETVCNNKLIGARNCVHGAVATLFPYEVGQGTHTSSTAAGNFVKGANANGNGNGTAVGMAPHAHLAIYKGCSVKGCKDGDVLAAIDAAVEDGVDVISICMVDNHVNYNPFCEDTIAMGAFGAT